MSQKQERRVTPKFPTQSGVECLLVDEDSTPSSKEAMQVESCRDNSTPFTPHSSEYPSAPKRRALPTTLSSRLAQETSPSLKSRADSSTNTLQDILLQNRQLQEKVVELERQLQIARKSTAVTKWTSKSAKKIAEVAKWIYGISKKAESFRRVFMYGVDEQGEKVKDTWRWHNKSLEEIATEVFGESVEAETNRVKEWRAWRLNDDHGGGLVSGTYTFVYKNEAEAEDDHQPMYSVSEGEEWRWAPKK